MTISCIVFAQAKQLATMALRDPPLPAAPRLPDWFASPPALSSSVSASAFAFDYGFTRPSAREIQATIAVVENAPDFDGCSMLTNDESERENRVGKEVDVSSWMLSNAFEILALRKSNRASWDRRLSSREVMERIRAVEKHEGKKQLQRQERKAPPPQARAEKDSDSLVSELSEPPLANASIASSRTETEEERKRRERAEARARKMEAIAARRSAGEDDDRSAVSGMSKRHRIRRKSRAVAALEKMEEKAQASTPVKKETEAERVRKQRAEARAKKLEAMFDQRNAGVEGGGGEDGASTVTGISRRHRARRKKSALATITPEERERNDWKKGIYASALNAEQTKWKRTIYEHALNAEATRAKNLEAQQQLDEKDAAAKRKLEKQKWQEEKAKKIAARAERFDRIRHERYVPADDDDDISVAGSVVSSASKHHRRRRRGRKSSSSSVAGRGAAVPTLGEETATSEAEERERKERELWCRSIYIDALRAEQSLWKRQIYSHALNAEEARKERLASEARREKERRESARAEKAERMLRDRNSADGVENLALYDEEAGAGRSGSGRRLSVREMRERRRVAAKRKSAWWNERERNKIFSEASKKDEEE